jgi:hypothetical protein
MQMIFDRNAARLRTCNWLRDCCYHFSAVKFRGIAAMAKCSILLKGSQMKAPIGRGVTDGGVLSVIGSTLLAQDE